MRGLFQGCLCVGQCPSPPILLDLRLTESNPLRSDVPTEALLSCTQLRAELKPFRRRVICLLSAQGKEWLHTRASAHVSRPICTRPTDPSLTLEMGFPTCQSGPPAHYLHLLNQVTVLFVRVYIIYLQLTLSSQSPSAVLFCCIRRMRHRKRGYCGGLVSQK